MRWRSAVAIAMVLSVTSVVRGTPDTTRRLQEADRLAWLTDWYGALPIYVEAQQAAINAGDRRDAMYAKFGRLRGQMQTRSLAELSEEIARDLDTPIAKTDLKLRLRGLTVKGDIDLEWDVDAAQQDWQQVRQVARELGDKGWENRATGELALVAFLKGKTGEASALVQRALQVATQSGDVGGQIRYMGAIANGLLLVGNASVSRGSVDRALALANSHPETGFPFVVYSTKILGLLALNQPDEAERFAKTAMAEAHKGDRRIKQVELLMMLAQIAEGRDQQDHAVEYLTQAITHARAGNVRRVLADAEAGIAEVYRRRGDLRQARRHAVAAVEATKAAGSRFTYQCESASSPTSPRRKGAWWMPIDCTIKPLISLKASWSTSQVGMPRRASWE
jgi:tetratricopeptide (TPR) repeat protein